MKPKTATAVMMMLPATPGTCVMCATAHDENAPHNYWSLFYGMRFKLAYGRDATHADCCAHMPEDRRPLYQKAVEEVGRKWTEPEGEAIAEPYAESQPLVKETPSETQD